MKPTDQQKPGTERRQYQKPQLLDYGRLADLTRATSDVLNMGDGAMAGLSKT